MSTSKSIVRRGNHNQEVTLTSAEAADLIIGEARSDALIHLGYTPADRLNAQEKAALDFFTIQYLVTRQQITKSAVVRMCLMVYESQNYHSLGYESWDEYCDGLATSDGTHAIEIAPEMTGYIRVTVPKLLAPLNASPIEITKQSANGEEPEMVEIINAETFLDGKFSNAQELAPLLRNNDPLDPTFRPVFERWVVEAAHSTKLDLRKKMHNDGLVSTHGPAEPKIPALRQLETHYTDPATGEIVDGEVTIITLYLTSRYTEKIFENRMGGFIAETVLANPQKK